MAPIVLAYSGGAASTNALRWLVKAAGAPVVTMTADLGQGADLADVRARSLGEGAVRAHVVDARDTLARDFVLPSLRAQALGEHGSPRVLALTRPLLARTLVEVARIEGAATVAHGCAPRDAARLGRLVSALDGALRVVSCDAAGTADLADQPPSLRPSAPLVPRLEADRVDINLWGRIVGSARLADAWQELPESVHALTKAPASRPLQPATVEIGFARGEPVALNGVSMPLGELVESLSFMAGEHGVGRLDWVKRRGDGTLTRVVVEAPAALVLHRAHAELQRLVSPDSHSAVARAVSSAYAGLIDAGEWFSPFRRALDAFADTMQESVTGRVRVRLFQGHADITALAAEAVSQQEPATP